MQLSDRIWRRLLISVALCISWNWCSRGWNILKDCSLKSGGWCWLLAGTSARTFCLLHSVVTRFQKWVPEREVGGSCTAFHVLFLNNTWYCFFVLFFVKEVIKAHSSSKRRHRFYLSMPHQGSCSKGGVLEEHVEWELLMWPFLETMICHF